MRIEIEGTGEVFDCPEADVIARAALRAGVGFPYGCNAGSCGNCRFEVLDGTVEHVAGAATAWTERDRSRARWLGCRARALGDCRINVRTSDPPRIHPTRRIADVIDTRPLAHDFSEITVAMPPPDAFLPGQYALLRPPGTSIERPYSMANLPGTGTWSFQVKQVPDGAMTGLLLDDARRPRQLVVDGPYGHGYVREGSRDVVLVAGGSGLAPMLSIARHLARRSPGPRITFFFGGRREHDLCARPMVTELTRGGAMIDYVEAVSEPSEGWTGRTGYISEVVLDVVGERLAGCEIYFAGPPAMVRAMLLMLVAAGAPSEHVHYDEIG